MTTADHIAAARAAVAQAKRDRKAAPTPSNPAPTPNVDHLRALTRKPETDENGSAA